MSYYQLPVVIDNGSGVIKAGLAGSREPQFVCPNIIGRDKGGSCAAEGAGELCLGHQAQARRSSLSIRYRLLPAGRTPRGGEGGKAQMGDARVRERVRKPGKFLPANVIANAWATNL